VIHRLGLLLQTNIGGFQKKVRERNDTVDCQAVPAHANSLWADY